MAIVIEDERGGSGGWFGFAVLMLILVILGVAAYYLFFVEPEILLAKIPTPHSLQPIDELSKISFDPGEVLSSQFFLSTSQIVPKPSALQPPGNSSPFGVF